jgi:hypothetical protein
MLNFLLKTGDGHRFSKRETESEIRLPARPGPYLRLEDGRQELATTRMPGATLGPFLAREQAVDGQTRQNAGSEQQKRMGFHRLERARRRSLEGEAGRGLVHDLLHPRQIFLACMNREIVTLVVLVPVEIDAVSGESA